MRIALLTDGITPYVIGGMQRHSYYLCKYLASQGVHVDLYHCDPQRKMANAPSVFTEEESKFITQILVEFPSFGTGYGHYIRESYDYSRRIYDKFKKSTEPDFVYAKGFAAWELVNQKSKGVKVPPIGINFHGYEMFQKQPSLLANLSSRLLFRKPVLFNIKHADYLFSYGGKITTIINSLGEGSKVVEIPGGIDADWIVQKPEPVRNPMRFLFVGRFERRKGVQELNLAIRMLQKQYKGRFEFEFVGSIPGKEKVAGCYYHGEVSDKTALQKIYRSADVLVAPSLSEGMPNVILEAMASGLMVIATDVGAVASLVDQQTGRLLLSSAPDAIYNAMKELIECDRSLIGAGKKSAGERVLQRFTWEKVGAETLSFLSKFPVG